MQKLSGGYVMIDLNDTNNIYARAKAAIGCGKPIMIFDDPECYYADSISLDGDDNVILTKGGKTITIESDGDITKTGNILSNKMEDITDANGNLRFIEGDITTPTITGVSVGYAKWSLSGTHLMIVLAGNIENNTSISINTKFGTISNLPDWIFNKIQPIFAGRILTNDISYYGIDYSTQDTYLVLEKKTDSLEIISPAVTTTAKRYFRIQFDLLIDNE